MSESEFKTKRRYSIEERVEFIEEFNKSNEKLEDFCKRKQINRHTMKWWLSLTPETKKIAKEKRQVHRGSRGPYSPEDRRRAIETYLKSGMTRKDFAKTWGIGLQSLILWHRSYEKHGPQGLENNILSNAEAKRGPKGISEPLKNEIVEVRKENPSFGLRKIKDFLGRFKGVKVSTGTINKTIKENNLGSESETKKKSRKPPQVRRFERAKPMQLWQSDITSYVLTRHSQRVYLTVFIDDNSRYIVSWNLQMRQTNELVLDALLDGVQRFGKPEEVLTDQGRQYFAWRGKSDFQKLLDKEGIKHVVARSHHPQTLGKCERFWRTVMEELWDRAKPQELTEARERIGHFIAHYNHFRPHQGLDGMTPADRFFGIESEVRKVIEETISKNELRLALSETPRSPVFLIGQIDGKPLSMHGERGSIVINTPDGGTQKVNYENLGHGKGKINDAYQGQASQDRAVQAEYDKANDEGVASRDQSRRRDRETSSQETTRSSEESQGAVETGASGENAVVDRNHGTEETCPSDRSVNNGILDGTNNEGRCRIEVGSVAIESMATVATSDFGNARRPSGSAEDEGQRDDNEQRRRSEIFKEENSRAGESDSNARSLDCSDARDAGLQGSNYDGCAESAQTSGSEASCEESEEDTARSSS